MAVTKSICVPVVLDLLVPRDEPLPVDAELVFRPEDPYAVTVEFVVDEDERITWTFARQLLHEGTVLPTGDGDVRVWPADGSGGRVLRLRMSAPSGRAVFEVRSEAVVEFLLATYACVPAGTEVQHLDLDAALRELLA